MNIGVEPGLMTDELLPFGGSGLTYPDLVKSGFTWVTYQAYNPKLFVGVKEFDLKAVKAHGFKSVGIWGVIYDRDDFYHAGKAMAQGAVDMGAQNLVVNTEEVYKGTRPDRLGKEIIKGIRDGGWKSEVSLSTLGAPWSPLVNDYQMDEESFLETGGSIIPEAYYNESEGYKPFLCKQYLDRLKIPQDRQNYMIGLYSGKRGHISGAAYVPLLEEASIGKNFSCYMIQHMTQNDATEIGQYIRLASGPVPPPLPTNSTTAAQTRVKITDDADAWLRNTPGINKTTRILLCRRIASAGNTDPKWDQVKNQIKGLMDKAGIP
jgi:hypothetical protein